MMSEHKHIVTLRRWGIIATWTIAVGIVAVNTASAQVLLRDDFDDASLNFFGTVDPTTWRLPFETEGTFVGRTQYRGDPLFDLPLNRIPEAGALDGFVTEISLDTYSPIDPGNQFLGTDLLSKRNFARGGGLTVEARLRLVNPVVGGIVGGFFGFDVTRDSPPGADNLVRDEIDFELLSNQVVSGTQDITTNVYSEAPFTGAGSGGDFQIHDATGLDLTQFHTYKYEWTPNHVKWYVDDALVRTDTSNVPDDPMKVHFNVWAPDSGFAAAYDAALQPAASSGSNQNFKLQVDHVEVNRIDTIVSDNLLVDGSFETQALVNIETGPPATTTGAWIEFSNTFIEENDVPPGNFIPTTDGVRSLKAFGPFKVTPDASGAFQNVAALPGEEFEASVSAITLAGDSIDLTENFATIGLSFLDASGAVLQEAFGGPGNLVDTNGRDFPLLDGRDPFLFDFEDIWVDGTVSAIAPEGTAFARVSLFFVQLANEGGSVYYDDASLVRLTLASAVLPGDGNGDGWVDGLDYLIWAGGFGTHPGADGDPSDGDYNDDGWVDGLDYLEWAANFGTHASTSVPEPSALSLLLGAVASLTVCRRRSR